MGPVTSITDSTSYQTVYDVSRGDFPCWWIGIVGALALLAGVASLIGSRRAAIRGGTMIPDEFVQRVGFGLCLASALAAAWFIPLVWRYQQFRKALHEGEFVNVEGPVTDFTPGDAGDHRAETFTVSGHRFEYSPSVVTVGFHHTQPHGGSIREGLRVRIAAVDGEIVRLQVAR